MKLFKIPTVKKSGNQLRIIFNHSPHRRILNKPECKGNFMGSTKDLGNPEGSKQEDLAGI